jgi:peptidoglycan/xylan/chitin deacetylase (PgdA/CDA1 family)
MKQSKRRMQTLLIGCVAFVAVVVGLGWHQQHVAVQRVEQVLSRAKHAHHGRVVTEKTAAGQVVYLLPHKGTVLTSALRHRAQAALPKQGQHRVVLVQVSTGASVVSGVQQQRLTVNRYWVKARHDHQQTVTAQSLRPVRAATGQAATVADIVSDDYGRRAINYAAKQALVAKHRQTPASLAQVLDLRLLNSMTATNFRLSSRQLTVTDATGKAEASVPLARIQMYLKGQTAPVASGKVIALTFDDGPNSATTPQILKTLAAAKVQATFFMVGTGLTKYPDTARAVARAGHEIGIHTYDHPYLPKLTPAAAKDEIYGKMAATYYQVFGQLPTLLRPPFGALSLPVAQAEDLPAIQWSIDSQDWRSRNAAAICQRVQATAEPGGIVLMHDIQPATVQALPSVIQLLKAQGYQFVTVSQLLGGRLLPGHQYFGRGDERLVTAAG